MVKQPLSKTIIYKANDFIGWLTISPREEKRKIKRALNKHFNKEVIYQYREL